MSSENEPSTALASEGQNGTSDGPTNSAAPTNGELDPTEATSEANKAATALDEPALPPASPSDENKNTGKETDLDMKATSTVEGAISGAQVVAPEGDGSSSAKKNSKRKSSMGVPEHKGKKLQKKKSMVSLNLDAKPGDYYWARMKGYPPWPAIVCDEEMLPASLLQNRPVTAMRPDGTYREDYQEGGKNAKDRTYPVMYLGTNEFSWTPNVDLKPLDFADVENAEQGKKSKQLWSAYELAKERHELQHFKDLLAEHEEALREELAEAEQAEVEKAEKAEKKEKKAKRKSKGAETVVDEDVDMEDDVVEGDEESGRKAKPSKKRKKEVESEEESAKPAKTPKTKLKVNLSKNADGESASKSKAKPKASKATKESPKPTPMTEAEKRQKREKEVLYFRHKLQKGFLSTDQAPKEAEMKAMAEYFTSLEAHEDLEHSIIRSTKIHKVLKAILKLTSIPKDEEYHFKQRSMDLLQKWQKILADNSEGGDGLAEKADGDVEGDTGAGAKDVDMKDEAVETTEVGNDAKDEADDGDSPTTATKDEEPAVAAGGEETSATTETPSAGAVAVEVDPAADA